MVAAVGVEDNEHPEANLGAPALRLQRKLTDVVDRRIATGLANSLSPAHRWGDVARLKEASHPECNHEWLWQTSPDIGACFTPVEYVTAVRLRLGAAGPDEPALSLIHI